MKKKVLLIDGNSFCYRAFYAIKSLSTSQGQPTNAIYGFVTMLNKLVDEHKPDYLAVTFDLKGPTFRHKQFSDYKIQRKPMPDELSNQIPIIKEILKAYNIPIFEKEGYEADDIIATLVKRLTQAELEILIVTGDKDILQIVNNGVKVLNPHKDNQILDQAWVRTRFGVEPEQIVEIMALAGDKSDNIPGVPGIGEATAIELIKRFGTLEAVLANVDQLKNKDRAEKIKEFSQQARMSRQLANLDMEVPELTEREPFDLLAQLAMTEADEEKLFTIFKRLEFKSLMEKVAGEFTAELDYTIVANAQQAEQYFKQLQEEETVTFYLAANRSQQMQVLISGMAFACGKGKSLFFPSSLVPLDTLKPILESTKIKKIGHDLKYAKVLLSNYGIMLQNISFDTMIAAYLLKPESLKYDLRDLALEYLNCSLMDEQTLSTAAESGRSCCQNVSIIQKLSRMLKEQLKEKGLLALFENIEMPLIEVLAEMEKEGVAIDQNLVRQLSGAFDKKLKSLTQAIYEMAGENFNINSPKQLSAILFEKLKLPKIKRTKTGSSTDTEVLQRLALEHSLPQALLEFREIAKLKSTYIDGLIKLLDAHTGRVYASFNQTQTVTGRLSSSRPNLQNIPIKTELGKKIRQIFIPNQKDSLLLSADYSQIELRILAHLSGDENLVLAFAQDLDIHTYTASLIFGTSQDKITAAMRDTAKTVNFGIIYGMSAYGLAKDLGIGQAQALEFIEAYFQRYPGVKSYIQEQIETAKSQGYVTTLLKRRRYIPQIHSPDENIRQFAQRAAINAPVQGSAADLIKAAMVQIHRQLKTQGLSAKMIIQVHDELVFSVPQKELTRVLALVKDKMENVIRLKVPIKVAMKTGRNWMEVK